MSEKIIDPLRRAASLLGDIAAEIARLETQRDDIDAKITTALQVAAANGFDRAAVRSAARSLKGGGLKTVPLVDLYLAATKIGD